jgi:PAS domain S-box-containing protein
MLVEDDVIVAASMAENLRHMGYDHVQTLSSGEEALAWIERQPPDVVLMDIELSGPMDGIAAANQIWNVLRIPVIYVTSDAAPATIARARQTEPFGFLVKPFHVKELYAAIETALYRRRMEHTLQQANQQLAAEIQERQQVEAALRESEQRFRRISELISDYAYVFRIDEDGRWVQEWVTDAFTRITGYAPAELGANGGWLTLVHPDDRALFEQHRQTLLTGQKIITDYRILTRYDDTFWLRDYGSPVWDEAAGRVVQVFGAAQDISIQKQAAEERQRIDVQLRQTQRLEALGTLAGGMAHDFNNILGTMLGYTDLLLDAMPEESQERVFLERIGRAGKRARDLVQQMLTFSRVHTAQPLEPLNLALVIDEAVTLLGPSIPANVRLDCRFSQIVRWYARMRRKFIKSSSIYA